ncbi:MAG: hypothetical protein K2Y71_09920 [Xanthobacteraceae bacterium]|nr:hypothetical protein [Xanthobacteraceae bacterium]
MGDFAIAAEETFAEIYAELSLRMPTPTLVVVCHAFGCSHQTHIVLSAGDRARLSTLLAAGKASPAAERRALAGAVQWFERRIGPVAGTTQRVARAGAAEARDPGQMDCIDLSANNTSLLLVLMQLKLLQHHRPELPVSRGFLIDGRLPHTTAVFSEVKSGQRFAVDNWTRKYGELPEVLPLNEWRFAR